MEESRFKEGSNWIRERQRGGGGVVLDTERPQEKSQRGSRWQEGESQDEEAGGRRG